MQRFSVSRFPARVRLQPGTLTPVVLSLLVFIALPLRAQASNLEVGTVLAAGNVIWVRATTSGSVAFFMSRGYRDALARPTMVDANRLALWTDSAKALHAPASGVADAKAPSDSGLAFDRWVGTDSSGLEIKRDGSTILRVSDTPAREVVDLLARGAELTRRLSTPSRPVAVAQAQPRPHPSPAPAPAPAATITMRQVAIASPVATQTTSPVSVAVAAPPAPLPVSAAEQGVTATEPVQTSSVSRAPAPIAAAPSVPATRPSPPVDSSPAQPLRVPNLQPSLDAHIPHDAPVNTAMLQSRREALALADVKAARLPPVTTLDKHIDTPLGPFVVPVAKLVDHDTQIKYCYTELGLRYDRHLTGDVTVRVSLNDAGFADTVEVTKRTWDGVPAAEVESCMRALIEDWSFDDRQPPNARTVELHFSLTPAMRTATTDGFQPSSQPR